MIDNHYLKELLGTLNQHGVKHIKMQGLELQFHVEQSAQKSPGVISSEALVSSTLFPAETEPKSTFENIAETIKKQEESLPVDLRADTLMDQDKILNWSSPQAFEEEPLPLTGEEAL